MKKFTLFLFVLLGLAVTVNAQYDKKALEKLEAMSAKYQKTPAYQSKFIYSLINDVENIQEDFEGTIIVKGDKFKLSLDEQEIFNNGVTVWTYLPEMNEVNIDNYNPTETKLPLLKYIPPIKKATNTSILRMMLKTVCLFP